MMSLNGDLHIILFLLAITFNHFLCFVLNETENQEHRVHFGIAAGWLCAAGRVGEHVLRGLAWSSFSPRRCKCQLHEKDKLSK